MIKFVASMLSVIGIAQATLSEEHSVYHLYGASPDVAHYDYRSSHSEN